MANLVRWRSPFRELSTVQNEMNDVFDRFFGRETERPEWWGEGFPPANISETNDNVVVTLEIPGMDPKDIDVSVAGDVLTVKGEKKQDKEEKGETWHRTERSYGTFSRTFTLPVGVDPAKSKATLKQGVLEVRLPKAARAKSAPVKVRVA